MVYIPRLIESAEQAETLPVGTVAVRLDDQGRVWTANRRCRCEEPGCGAWFSTDWDSAETHANVVGASALVPVEVIEGPGGHGRSWYINAPDWE